MESMCLENNIGIYIFCCIFKKYYCNDRIKFKIACTFEYWLKSF